VREQLSRPHAHANPKAQNPPGKVRIIGGEWRGRRIPVADVPDLRPTPDRVRETLFNWLQATIPGSRCLDLFAGTGALGFEAASRGAADVVMLEKDRRAAETLRQSAELLHANQVEITETDALQWLEHATPKPFDIVFLDPPFQAGLWTAIVAKLAARPWLASNAVVYVEAPAKQGIELPPGWDIMKQSRAGQVEFALVHLSSPRD
jgi:16S rRNA (guanine966-N2)-methyltransferase